MAEEKVVQRDERNNSWFSSDFQYDIWDKKYRLDGESLDEWFDRVSLGDIEIRKLIEQKKFIPAGRILANIGRPNGKYTLSNCYVIPPPDDNIESIFDRAKAMARTYSYGGGCGIDISTLAPKGAKINNAAKESTGAVSFMDLYSAVTGLIGQAGRRGALMISIADDHPDVFEFIHLKDNLDKVTKANISVRLSDRLFESIKEGKKWRLQFTRYESGEVIDREIDPRDIIHAIAESAWKTGEPGALFWGNIENGHFLSEDPDFKYAGTNPCITGDTLISTTDGEIPIKDLVGKHPDVFCYDKSSKKIVISKVNDVWMTKKNANVIKITTVSSEIICTPDHKIYSKNKGVIEASKLDIGDLVITDKGAEMVMDNESVGKADVYDMNVSIYHNFVANGIVVSNCGEEPLPAGGACLLSAINLSEFVENPFTSDAYFDFDELRRAVKLEVRYMNRVLDINTNLHPLEIQKDTSHDYRQIGCGITGYADALVKLGKPFTGSKELADSIARTYRDAAVEESILLAHDNGGPYPKFNYEYVSKSRYFNDLPDYLKEGIRDYGLRNSQILTIAPNGSISAMLGSSYGIEPIYDIAYTYKTESLVGETKVYTVYVDIVKQYLEAKGRDELTESDRLILETAKTLDYVDRIEIQSIFQKYIDGAISSTVNLPEEATVEDIEDIYMLAHDKGLKGITVFRDNCERAAVLVSLDDKKDEEELSNDGKVVLNSITPLSREEIGDSIAGITTKYKCACGSLYITINHDENANPIECFITTSKSGTCKSNIDALARMISLSLRSGVKVTEIVDQLQRITCLACTRTQSKGNKIDGLSCPDIISKCLMKYVIDEDKDVELVTPIESKVVKEEISEDLFCPECGAQLEISGGCRTCRVCGWSRCDG